MPRIHPKPDALTALAGRLPREERRLLRHALDCATCREEMLEALRTALDRRPGRVLSWRAAEPDYGRAIDGVLQSLRPRLCEAARDQAEAPALLAELLRHPAERRELLLRNSARFHSFGLCELLLRESREEILKDPRPGEELARLGLHIVDLLDAEQIGARLIEDVRARAWALIGNARRVLSDLYAAEEAFATATIHLKAGTGDRLELARLLAYESSLRRCQRRFAEASALLRRVISIYLESGEEHLAAEAMVARAIVAKQVGKPAQAIELLRRAGSLVPVEDDPRLAVTACHNLLDVLVDEGCLLEAQALVARSRALYREHAPPRIRLRLLWIEGKMARDLGRPEEALELMEQARQGFLAQGIGYDAAMVSLDLAAVCARLGRGAEVRRLAEEILPIFHSREVHREALAALIVFQQAAAAERATLGLVEEIAAYLRRAANDPSLPFESAAVQ